MGKFYRKEWPKEAGKIIEGLEAARDVYITAIYAGVDVGLVSIDQEVERLEVDLSEHLGWIRP